MSSIFTVVLHWKELGRTKISPSNDDTYGRWALLGETRLEILMNAFLFHSTILISTAARRREGAHCASVYLRMWTNTRASLVPESLVTTGRIHVIFTLQTAYRPSRKTICILFNRTQKHTNGPVREHNLRRHNTTQPTRAALYHRLVRRIIPIGRLFCIYCWHYKLLAQSLCTSASSEKNNFLYWIL